MAAVGPRALSADVAVCMTHTTQAADSCMSSQVAPHFPGAVAMTPRPPVSSKGKA